MLRASAAALLGFLAACGPLPSDVELGYVDDESAAIINGHACTSSEMPSAVAILVDAEVDFGGFVQEMRTPICTGTLVAPDAVIAAAHCFDSEGLTMGFGTVTREAYYASFHHDLVALAEGSTTDFPTDAIEAVSWTMHPQFTLDSMSNVNGPGDYKDVAIMFLSQAVSNVEPAIIIAPAEDAQQTTGTAVDIAGWGQQTQTAGPFDPPPPGTVGAKHCATSFINEIGSHEMQIGGDASTSRKCHGDSGGPTYMVVETEHSRDERVIGITSHAYNETDCAMGGVDTRVDVWRSWLDGEMRAACENGTRVWCEEPGVISPAFYDPKPDAGSPGSGGDDGHVVESCLCAGGASSPSGLLFASGALAALSLLRRRRR